MRRMNKKTDEPNLIELIRKLHSGRTLYKYYRMWLAFGPDSFNKQTGGFTNGDYFTPNPGASFATPGDAPITRARAWKAYGEKVAQRGTKYGA